MSSGSFVRLPPAITPPFDVFVNGVPQREGEDFTVDGDRLLFTRELAQEGRLGLRRWLLGSFGIGTYRPHHSVDVRYEADGRTLVAEGLPVEPAPPSAPPKPAQPAGD